MEEVPSSAFYYSHLESLYIPKNIKKINYAGFAQISELVSIEFEEGSTCEIDEYAFAKCYSLTSAKIPSTITKFGENIFYYARNDFTIYGTLNSAANTYANENNYNFSAGKVNIVDRFISMNSKNMVYEPNKELEPDIVIKYMSEILERDRDYVLVFDENKNKPGSHTVTIKGINDFEGEVSKTYDLKRAECRFDFDCDDIIEGDIFKEKITNPDNQKYGISIYDSNGRYYSNFESNSGKKINWPGAIGTYKLQIIAYPNDYYYGKTMYKYVTIKPATISLQSISIDGGDYRKIHVGESIKLSLKYEPENTTIVKNVIWTTRYTDIIKLEEDGTVTGIAEGYAMVYAVVAGKQTYCWIDVEKKENNNSNSNNSNTKPNNNNNNTNTNTNTNPSTNSGKLPFKDVNSSDWFYSAVEYAYNNKMISGYNETTFAPNDKLTRGMIVTILYKMEGQPASSATNKFSDVSSKEYYAKAVSWAESKGIVHGYGGTTCFGPDDNILRQDLAGILRNYANYKNKNVSITSSLSRFSDYGEVDDYAIPSMQWAVGSGVITGNANGTLNPKGNANRAEAAAMIQKYCLKIGR